MNLSDELFRELYQLGVDCIFFVAGGNAMYLNNALKDSQIRAVAAHHEQTAAIAAEAYSRTSDSIGGCLATSGPGVSNLVTGLAGAFLDSVPVIAIVGQAKESLRKESRSDFLRQGGLFELPNEEILGPVIKGFFRVDSLEAAISTPRDAIRLATSGRPGPVVIEVGLEFQGLSGAGPGPKLVDSGSSGYQTASSEGINFRKAFARSKRPLIVAGRGVQASRTEDLFLSFVEKFQIPFVTTQLAKGIAPFNHNLFIGHPGPRGDRAGNEAVQTCDLLVSIGTSLGSQTTGYETSLFSSQSRKIVQDLGNGVSGKNLEFSNTEYSNLDAHAFITEMHGALADKNYPTVDAKWISDLIDTKVTKSVASEPHTRDATGHNMYDFVDDLSYCLSEYPEPAAIITDAGLAFYVMGQAFRLSQNHSYTVSGGLGSMGYALPAVIGQSQSHKNSLVIGISGDGSTQMNVQEFATLKSIGANAGFFVLNNNGYASIRNTQDSFFGQRIGSSPETGVNMPNWQKIAEAYDLEFIRITTRDNLRERIDDALQGPTPVLVEVICQPNQQLMPFVPNYIDDLGQLRSKPLNCMSPSADTSDHYKTID